ncbi:hypothetical protein N9383_06700 [Granulosicoccus sp.]|nr:hypothetical protein [Granulosicoccus sp.]
MYDVYRQSIDNLYGSIAFEYVESDDNIWLPYDCAKGFSRIPVKGESVRIKGPDKNGVVVEMEGVVENILHSYVYNVEHQGFNFHITVTVSALAV